jgi:hypothetical protein
MGSNDSCSCGSGKKFKKCCQSKGLNSAIGIDPVLQRTPQEEKFLRLLPNSRSERQVIFKRDRAQATSELITKVGRKAVIYGKFLSSRMLGNKYN